MAVPGSSPKVREKISRSMVELVGTNGFRELTVQLVLEHAGVDQGDFNYFFENLNDCYVQLEDEILTEFVKQVLAAYAGPETWRDQVRAAAYAVLHFMEEDFHRARFLGEYQAAGPEARVRRDRLYPALTKIIDAGRQELDDPQSVPPSTAEGIVAAVGDTIAIRLKAGEVSEAGRNLVPQLMYMVVRPYLGEEVAREELRIQPPG